MNVPNNDNRRKNICRLHLGVEIITVNDVLDSPQASFVVGVRTSQRPGDSIL